MELGRSSNSSQNSEGENHRLVLEWSGLSVQKRTGEFSLFKVAGSLRGGRLTALVGPSGSGKTLLLESLSGRLEKIGKGSKVILDETFVLSTSEMRRNLIGFVSSKEELIGSVTPREALAFSAALRPGHAEYTSADFYLNLLDLESCADTPFSLLGDINRKRFATMACEMITERKILLLDAPLTGLSQLGGYQFVRTLKKFVSNDCSVLSGIMCSLLQPTSEVLSLFDDIILMAEKGQVIYQGPVLEMSKYFMKFGHECPMHYNISDFALFVLHSITAIERDRIACEMKQLNTLRIHAGPEEVNRSAIFVRQSYWKQLKYLTMREYRDNVRNWKSKIMPRILLSVFVSVVIGCVYYQIGDKVTVNSSSYYMQGYYGCIMVVCCNAMFANAQATVLALPAQKDIFQREHSLGMYSSMAYLAAKFPMDYATSLVQVFVQLIIEYFLCSLHGNFGVYLFVLFAVSICTESIALSISCLTSSAIAAIQILPLAIFPQIIFSGLIISIQSMPSWVSWIQYMCFLPYALKILTINEFGCADIAEFTSNNIDCTLIGFNAFMLIFISAIFRLVALIALQFKPKTFRI